MIKINGVGKMKKSKAQSTLEYITVFVVVVAAIVAFAGRSLKPATENVLSNAAARIQNAANQF